MADETTTTNPNATPVSSPTTSIYNPLTPTPLGGVPAGTELAPIVVEGEVPTTSVAAASRGAAPGTVPAGETPEDTSPQIWIASALPTTGKNGVTIQFDYMPENVSFGVSCVFGVNQAIPQTSARFMTYDHSEIEEVSLTVKAVAGCNNCLTFFSTNTSTSNYQAVSPLVASKYERISLIRLARALYSLPLPSDNTGINGGGQPPITARLKVGKMFSGVGVFTRCSIQFNGPYDFDGSPTDMEVSLGFMPSEYWDSTHFAGTSDLVGLVPKATPTAESELTGEHPYALYFGATTTGVGGNAGDVAKTGDESNPSTTPTPSPSTITSTGEVIPGTIVQGPTSPTPTNAEAAAAEGYAANEVYYDQKSDTYYFGTMDPKTGQPIMDPNTGKPDAQKYTPYGGDVVRSKVESDRAGVRPSIGP